MYKNLFFTQNAESELKINNINNLDLHDLYNQILSDGYFSDNLQGIDYLEDLKYDPTGNVDEKRLVDDIKNESGLTIYDIYITRNSRLNYIGIHAEKVGDL